MIKLQLRPNEGQSALWNARGGKVWVEQQQMLDRLFQPFEHLLTEIVIGSGARKILDIGCGAGATTLAVARGLVKLGQCTGIDISVPLVAAARRRAEVEGVTNAQFITRDAQTHEFRPGSFDSIISRFGVMFFDDPEVTFANLRRTVCAGAGLTAITWRDAAENPFMIAAERAAAPFLPQLTPRDPAEPGQFAFGDAGRVRRILAAHWQDINIEPLDVRCTLSEDDLNTYSLNMGRVGLLLPDLIDRTRVTVESAIRRAFEPFVSDGIAQFTAACWLVRARAG